MQQTPLFIACVLLIFFLVTSIYFLYRILCLEEIINDLKKSVDNSSTKTNTFMSYLAVCEEIKLDVKNIESTLNSRIDSLVTANKSADAQKWKNLNKGFTRVVDGPS